MTKRSDKRKATKLKRGKGEKNEMGTLEDTASMAMNHYNRRVIVGLIVNVAQVFKFAAGRDIRKVRKKPSTHVDVGIGKTT